MLFSVVEAVAPPEIENVIEIVMKGKLCVHIFVFHFLDSICKCFKIVFFHLVSYSFIIMAWNKILALLPPLDSVALKSQDIISFTLAPYTNISFLSSLTKVKSLLLQIPYSCQIIFPFVYLHLLQNSFMSWIITLCIQPVNSFCLLQMCVIKVHPFCVSADLIPPFCNPFHFPEQCVSCILKSAFHMVQI